MASQAQIEANRRNGAKSRGPKTPEGKAISRQNVIKHRLCSEKIFVLTYDDSDNNDDLIAACATRFNSLHEIAAARLPLRPCADGRNHPPRYPDQGTRIATAFSVLAGETALRRSFQ